MDLERLTGMDQELLAGVLLDNKDNALCALRPVVLSVLGAPAGSDFHTENQILSQSGLTASKDTREKHGRVQ